VSNGTVLGLTGRRLARTWLLGCLVAVLAVPLVVATATRAEAMPTVTFTVFGGRVNRPTELVSGPDGNLWFTADATIGRMTPAGVFTIYQTAGLRNPHDIKVGPDGNLWFADNAGAIGRVTMCR